MNTIFMNSKKSKTSDPHILLLNLTDKVSLRRKDMYIYIYILLCQVLVFTIHGII